MHLREEMSDYRSVGIFDLATVRMSDSVDGINLMNNEHLSSPNLNNFSVLVT
jgi:hypothetical protein